MNTVPMDGDNIIQFAKCFFSRGIQRDLLAKREKRQHRGDVAVGGRFGVRQFAEQMRRTPRCILCCMGMLGIYGIYSYLYNYLLIYIKYDYI